MSEVRFAASTDSELVRHTLRGDRDAFGRLVERHRRTIYALALQRGFQAAEAEDVAQEVFIKAFRGLGALKEADLFERWLYGIAAHVMADAARARKRRFHEESTPDSDLERLADDSGAPPYDRVPLSLGEETSRVLDALGALSEEHRVVVTLRYMHGLSPKEIAARISEPRGTIRSRLHHALLHLQKALGVPVRKNESARTRRAEEEAGG